MTALIGRREFITLIGGAAAAWPPAARAQQPAMPVIGFIYSASPDPVAHRLRAFRQGLKESGYVEGENIVIEYRWVENRIDRLPEMVAELIGRRVTVIVAMSTVAAVAAKAANTTIPIVFQAAEDPVRLGVVASLARPGGNATGINVFNAEVTGKRLGFLRDLVPTAKRVGVLVDPNNAAITESVLRDAESAARTMGLQILVVDATTSREIDAAFATFVREQVDALFVGPSGFFSSRRVHIASQAMRHGIPAAYSQREIPEVGGLLSYGTNLTDAWRQVGVYAGRVLKGAKPADLPVLQSTKFELVINAQTARLLGLTVPPGLLVAADEVIE
jgi:putative tryptophan/tyrosine transport system substrate-binding protein